MAEQKISAKAVAADIKSGMGSAELMQKYGLSPKALEYVFQKLIENNLVTTAEVSAVGQAPSTSVQSPKQEPPASPPSTPSEPSIDPQLAKAIVEDVRKGKHDYDIMIRLGLARDELSALMENLVRAGHLSAEEVEARKPGKSKQCPYCHSPVFEGAVTCKSCGRDLTRPMSSRLARARPNAGRAATENVSDDQDCAWEEYWQNRGSRGLFKSYFHSVHQCIASPARFFSSLSLDSGYWAPALFGAICAAVPMTSHLVLLEILTGKGGDVNPVGWPIFLAVCYFLAALVFFAVSLPISSLLVHGSLMILGGAHERFQTTFRVVAYSWVTSLLGVIPILGSLIGSPWGFYLALIGLRETHKTSTGRAFGAVLIPFCISVAIGTLYVFQINPMADSRQSSSQKKPMISRTYTGTEFKSGVGQFSVFVPAPLKEKKIRANTVAGKVDMTLFNCKEGNIEYSVMCSDSLPSYGRYLRYLPSFLLKGNPDERLDKYPDRIAKSLNGKILNQTRITLDDYPGKEVVIEGGEKLGNGAVVKAQAFLVKDRLYQIMVVVPNGELSTPAVNDFFDSFTLLIE